MVGHWSSKAFNIAGTSSHALMASNEIDARSAHSHVGEFKFLLMPSAAK